MDITKNDVKIAFDSYVAFRKKAIENKNNPQLKHFTFSDILIEDNIKIKEYKEPKVLTIGKYKLRWIQKFLPSGKQLLIYEK
jgi:hypothetical protein